MNTIKISFLASWLPAALHSAHDGWRAPVLVLLLVLPLTLSAQPSEERVHVVEKGETLWGIAEKYLLDPLQWEQLQQSGKVKEPKHLQPGVELAIPGMGSAFPAKVLHLEGQAWLLAHDGEVVELVEGQALGEGQGVRTEANAYVSLGFADGTRVVLPSLTTVTLGSRAGGGNPQVNLSDGEVEAYVLKHPARK